MSLFIKVTSAADLVKIGVGAAASSLLDRIPEVPPGYDALIYCDGACSGNGVAESAPGGWGVLIRVRDTVGSTILVGCGGMRPTTNNQMELTAPTQALMQLSSGAKALVRTDSQYVIKGCTEWRKGWVRNGMRNSKKEPVANQDFWADLWREVDAKNVTFQWVKGHDGDPGNEVADSLAVLGAKNAKQ